ncbi:uncharacterized protein LOC126736234 [Anthonomus grandis grandis]|uniref:uncharacterized protein LOC126736234 n=1 Tax=Anthonomus grandis grandis TaxID=2921223 RepID=UPI002165722F|nr:uncharacterized protein LOC126736234 [Anthonomus grandis grandis]
MVASGKISELRGWISKLKRKRRNFKYEPRKNLFVEAILANALTSTQAEIRKIQEERVRKWRNSRKFQSACGRENYENSSKIPPDWDPDLYAEINADIDKFMSQLTSKPKCS